MATTHKTTAPNTEGQNKRRKDNNKLDSPAVSERLPPTGCDKAISEARRFCQYYQTMKTKAKALLDTIAYQAQWQWANDDKNNSGIVFALEGVRAAASNVFFMTFFKAEVKELRTKFTAAELETKCADMLADLRPAVKKLDGETKLLIGMHAARGKAAA